MLAELRWRAEKAHSELGRLFSGEAKYYREKAELIVRELDLPSMKASMLLDFAEKAIECLDKAYAQAEAKLRKLLTAIENNSVEVAPSPRGRKAIHITPEGEKWYINAHLCGENWLFSLPIYRVSAEAEFPDILGLNSEALYYLQAGWRASDEGKDKHIPKMSTTQPWQVLAWTTVRYGILHIYLSKLCLNMTKPSINWIIIAKSWAQQWPMRKGKKIAQQVAKLHPLGLLTWYLGDGIRDKNLKFSIGNGEKYVPKQLAQQILRAAYQTGYGKLLDLLDSEKWTAIKRLQPKQHPVYATLQGHTFWLNYCEGEQLLQGRALFKDLEDALKLAKALADMGIRARVHIHRTYYVLFLSGKKIVKLAENSLEWRRALRQLAQKYNLRPKTQLLRRLLELAENPLLKLKRAPYWELGRLLDIFQNDRCVCFFDPLNVT